MDLTVFHGAYLTIAFTAPTKEKSVRPGRAIRLFFGLLFMASIGGGCGDSKNPNLDDEGKPITAPVRPGLNPKAAEKMKNAMPHL